MTRVTVVLLFSKDKNIEPGGILQCDTSGEYFPFNFRDWRDGVHYIQWCLHNKKKYSHESFNIWSELYGYDDEEEFTGDLNEFRCKKSDEYKWIVFTSCCEINGSTNLKKKSAWNYLK